MVGAEAYYNGDHREADPLWVILQPAKRLTTSGGRIEVLTFTGSRTMIGMTNTR